MKLLKKLKNHITIVMNHANTNNYDYSAAGFGFNGKGGP